MRVSKTSELGVDSITFTFESDEEKRAMYAMFNFSHLTRLICSWPIMTIKRVIGDEHYVWRNTDIISNGITYKDFYTTNFFDCTYFWTSRGNPVIKRGEN